ncbi:MAG: efflux RND transporter permease subunit [Gammaproteobacteria bacterium]|nr:efflux RND transporter permease subunit [Gammaproteobacteria bacterium]
MNDHAGAIWLAVLLLTLGGIIAAMRLPVALFPHIDYPRVVIAIDAGARDSAQMAAAITRPIEIALRAVPGVTRIRSTTSRGAAEVALNFNWGEDMVAAKLAAQSALATLLPDLPPGTRFNVRRADPTIFPVLGIALTSRTLDQQALRQIAELQVRPALTAVPGVAGVDVLGGAPREFAVDVDPLRAQAVGLSLTDVAAALGRTNDIRGVGRLEDRHRLYLVLAHGLLGNSAELASIPVKVGAQAGAGVVTLGQIATIHSDVEPNYLRVAADGQNAVLLNIRQAITGDTVAIVHAVSARLQTVGLPPSVRVKPFYDQSELVMGAANSVRDAILLGAVLAGVVLFWFLRSVRLMVITGLMLPGVLAATCLLLFSLGMTFNMMTLGGMAAAVGLVVDDAVVMLEHVMRRLQEGKARGAAGLLRAAAEMGRPLVGSTTATIVVFLPLAFVGGVTGGFFKALAVTMVAALAVSLLYARFVIPLIVARWLSARDAEVVAHAGRFMDRLHRVYAWSAARAFARPGLFVGLVWFGMAGLGYLAWLHVPSGFMPRMDEGGFVLDYKAQPGAALTDTDRLLRQVEQIITATPEVESYSRRTGAQLGGGLTEADEGDYFIRLSRGARRPITDIMAELRAEIAARVPGLTIETIQLMEDLIGDLTAVPQPIEVKLFGDDPKALANAARQVGAALGKIPGVVEVIDGLRVAGDAISVSVNPAAAAQHGLDVGGVAAQIEALVGGIAATQVRIGAQLVTVRVRGPAGLRSRAAAIPNLVLTAPDGHTVRVDQIAVVAIVPGQQQLTREDLAPLIAVTARLEGRDLGSAMREVRTVIAGLQLPTAIRVDYGGLYAEQQKSFVDLTLVFVAALLLTALLLTVIFARTALTVAALATILLSAAAVLAGLWLTGIGLDISALMGLTMVVGMVTELVIFYLSELDLDRALDLATLRAAGAQRLRPILMSALIAVLTLSPLALGLNREAGLQQPLATAIIFGLIAAVPLVLLFLPALTFLLSGRARRDSPVATLE